VEESKSSGHGGLVWEVVVAESSLAAVAEDEAGVEVVVSFVGVII